MGESELKFFCDRMFGKLARKLRILGFDTLYFSNISEDEVLERSKGRILITRDKQVYRKAASAGMDVVFIDSDDWRSQLRKLALRFPIGDLMKPFTICVNCNERLVDVDPDEVFDKVPDHVYRSVEKFKMCPRCGKVYWKGTHVDWIIRDMEKLVGEWKTV